LQLDAIVVTTDIYTAISAPLKGHHITRKLGMAF